MFNALGVVVNRHFDFALGSVIPNLNERHGPLGFGGIPGPLVVDAGFRIEITHVVVYCFVDFTLLPAFGL
jgi:hypothetical protein